MKKTMSIFAVLFALFLFGGAASQAALTANAPYTITIQKMNSNGTVSDYSTTSAVADADGKSEDPNLYPQFHADECRL